MNNFMQALNKRLTPVAEFCATERHLASMQKGFMTMIGFIMVSAIFVIAANPPVTADMIAAGGFWSIFTPWFDFAAANKMTILIPYNMTMGMLSLIGNFSIAYNLSASYEDNDLEPMMTALISVIMFLLAAAPYTYYELADGTYAGMLSGTYLGAQGLFTSIIVALASVEITRFAKKHLHIRFNAAVPEGIAKTFNSIFPIAMNIVVWFGGNLILGAIHQGWTIPVFIETMLGAPLTGLINSTAGTFIICLLVLLFWCFGIHGNMIVMSFTTPVTMLAFANNAALMAAGKAPVMEPILVMNAINLLGGTGNPLSFLLLCITNAKSERLKAEGKAMIVPAVFRISEPVIFGIPIAYNPVLFIPFILSGLVPAILYYICGRLGLVTPMWLLVSGTFPIFINSYIKCLDWRMIVFELVMIPVTALIWYPFFKVYDNNCLKEEAATAQEKIS